MFLVNSITPKMNAELESKNSISTVASFYSLGFSTTSTSNTINFFLICAWDFMLVISKGQK